MHRSLPTDVIIDTSLILIQHVPELNVIGAAINWQIFIYTECLNVQFFVMIVGN